MPDLAWRTAALSGTQINKLVKVGHWSGNGFWWYLNNQRSNLNKTFRMYVWWEKMTNCIISSHLHNHNHGNRLFCENRYAWFCGRSCRKTKHLFPSFLFVMIHWSVVECNNAVFVQSLTKFIIKKKLRRIIYIFPNIITTSVINKNLRIKAIMFKKHHCTHCTVRNTW